MTARLCFASLILLLPHISFGVSGEPASERLVISGGRIFDANRGSMLPARNIFIQDGRIRLVEEAGKTPLRQADRMVDARGKFILPGLIDCHMHVNHVVADAHMTGDELLPYYLANGITSIASAGDEIVAEKLVERYAETNPERCPRLFLSSPLVDSDPPYHQRTGFPLTDPKQVAAFVENMSGWGVSTFKIYVGTRRPVALELIAEVHRRGGRVLGHLGQYSAQDAVADGIDRLEHIASVFDFILPPGTPTLPLAPERARMDPAVVADLVHRVAKARAEADLSQRVVKQLISSIVEKGVQVTPTLAVYRNWMLLRDVAEIFQGPDISRMPALLTTAWQEMRLRSPAPPETLELRRREFRKLQELTSLLYREGVKLLVGTDSPVPFCPPGYAYHQELELLVESGLPPASVLIAATILNARALGRDLELGTVEAGKIADLVILDADPLADILNTRRINRVIRGGILCEPAKILETTRSRNH